MSSPQHGPPPSGEHEINRPIIIWGATALGKPFVQEARAVRAGPSWALIAGMRHEVLIGEVLSLSFQERKARCCVLWVGQSGTAHEGQIQVRPLEVGFEFWTASPDRKVSGADRRNSPRFPCRGSISFRQQRGGYGSVAAAVTDISDAGCYVEVQMSLAVGSMVSVMIHIDEFTVCGTAKVTTSHPGVGMGLMFCEMGESDRNTLRQLLQRLDKA